MEFLFPQFLFGFIALTIPVIIHLFNFRRYKLIAFPTTRFLKEIKEESQRKSRLKHLLILLSRLLLISALVLAFSQPILPGAGENFRPEITAIALDNSYSMDIDLEGGRAFDIAKNTAFDLIASSDEDADFLLFTANYQNESNELLSKREALDRLKKLSSSSSLFNLNGISGRIGALAREKNARMQSYFLSDLQNSSLNGPLEADSSSRISIFYLERENISNLSLDSCWFENKVRRLNQSETISFKISNYGNEDRETKVGLQVDNQNLGRQQVNIPANSSFIGSFTFTVNQTGDHNGIIRLEDAPIDFDNSFYFSYRLEPRISVLYIAEKEDSLFRNVKSVFATDSVFNLQFASTSNPELSSFPEYSLIIVGAINKISNALSEALEASVNKGISLCIIPPAKGIDNSYNQFLSKFDIAPYSTLIKSEEKVKEIALESDFFKGVFENIPKQVDLPFFRNHYMSEEKLSKNAAIMRLSSGHELLGESDVSGNSVYVFRAFPGLSNGNFSRHALFVPTFLQMAINSRKSFDLYSIKSDRLQIRKISSIERPEEWRIRALDGDSSTYIPALSEDFLIIPEFSGSPGFYELKNTLKTASYSLAVNSNRLESDLNSIDEESFNRLKSQEFVDLFNIKGTERRGSLVEQHKHTELWKVFVLLALLFAAIEILLIKFL